MASTELRAAAQQALEALEGGADSWQRVGPAIDALKAALAEPVQEPVAPPWKSMYELALEQRTKAHAQRDALLEALKLMLEQFTKTPSTLKDSEARIKAHAAIAQTEGQ